MATSAYPIHRAIARPVSFKGFQAQYIIYAAISLIGGLFLFIILYCCKVNPWVCIPIAVIPGGTVLYIIHRLSRKYGVYGLMKKRAQLRILPHFSCRSRRPFLQLNKTACHTV